MLTNTEINALLTNASDDLLLTEIRQATVPLQVPLSTEMSTALGTNYRRLTPFLGVCVDVISSKLEIRDEEIALAKVGDSKAVRSWLGDDSFGVAERELWFAVVRDGLAYLLTSWTDNGPQYHAIERYHAGCGAHVEGDLGWNTWHQPDGTYLDVYYPDRIEKYSKGKEEKSEWKPRLDPGDESWPLDWTTDDGEPLGCALTKFEIDESDIQAALQVGRDMNEALLDMLAASRTQGWPQRFLKSDKKGADLLTDPFGQPMVTSQGRPIPRKVNLVPGSVMVLGESQQLDQLPETKADATLLDKLLIVLGFITTVPTHYFSGQWPSGIALITSESRLNHLVEEHQARLSSALARVVQLTMRLSNVFAGTAFNVEQRSIEIPWFAPQIETEDLLRERERHQQDSVTQLVEARLMSKKTALETLHPDWSEEQIAEELALLEADRPPPPPMLPQPAVQPAEVPA